MTAGVRAIIKDGDSIVMVSHQEKKYGKILLFPGGGIEKGESIFEATEREVFEETKLVVKAKQIMYIREVKYKSEIGLEFYVFCKLLSGKLELGNDPEHDAKKQILTDVERISITELRQREWKPEELKEGLIKDLDELKSVSNIKYLGLAILG